MVTMSRTWGMLWRVTGSRVNRAAAMSGSAEFFAPPISTRPFRGWPPRMQNLSISSQVHLFRESAAEIATGLVKSFASQFRRKTAFEHDERDTKIVFGLTQSVFYSRQILSAGFEEDAASAILKLLVRLGQVDHEVVVGMAQTNHRRCRKHVEDHFLGRASFDACGTGEDFWTDVGSDGDLCGTSQGRMAIGGNGDGESAFLFRVGDGGKNVGGRTARGEADERVILGEAEFLKITAGLGAIVFGAFDGISDGSGSASDKGANELG